MIKIFKISFVSIFIWSTIITSCKKENDPPIDGDGNVYGTVTIGTQIWLTENLKTRKTSLGATISLINDNSNWETAQWPAYCWYNNNEDFKDTYGALYNYQAIKLEGVCPNGYHIPSYEDWIKLFDFLGGVDIAGLKLRETGTIHWAYYNPQNLGTNEKGFTALPSGRRLWNGEFIDLYYGGCFWIYDNIEENKRYFQIDYSREGIGNGGSLGQPGYSVRCLKNN